MLTVHHLNNSRSHRVLWLLEELGVEYQIKTYERDPQTMLAPKSLRDVHPLGKSPVITHAGHTIAESGAILEYLVDTFGQDAPTQLRPAPDTPEFLRYRYWMHYAEGSAMPALMLRMVFDQLPAQGPWLARPLLAAVASAAKTQFINPQLRRHLAFWEEELAERAYFAGDAFSAADIQMSFVLHGAVAGEASAAKTSRARALLRRLQARPAYERAEARGGALDLSAFT
ncbi:glutathione S-transferase family protein [Bradymonas sediminis]|uniref:glutathione transferase n=1 Tax=Bradymonas sediminis TaxID=1548548 RepID=A0A2Z4FJC9_9DELT|nr:glutathione S-transferase [Bradymonas sediminis]AWV89121.1 glutathione S-transferase [Bradymonas sediminis]TDP64413.1 glutathione S-transferase [Bradymonas sediminis]